MGDLQAYLHAAKDAGLRLHYVIDTHVHADHLSVGRELARAAEGEYVLFDGADVAFPFKRVGNRDLLPLGNVMATIWHTPGHTPEHLCLLVSDRTRAEEPWFVLTGHTLMSGDLGRTELAVSAERGAKDLFQSAARLKTLPDYVEVFPGAYAGSVCGRSLSGKPSSTIGFEKRTTKLSVSRTKPNSCVSCWLRFLRRRPKPPDYAPLIQASLPRPDRWQRRLRYPDQM